MKKYIFPILFLFSSFGFSQFLGGTLIKDSKPVKRVATTLDTIAIATKRNYIEPAPTFKSQEANTVVGITAGQLDVSLTGGATYNIPITVPAGINGVVPQISLNYNSQGGNGIGGYGWNIGGLSTITKIASTKFHDNIIDPVDFDASDRYAFDGQRLMLKAGTTYGASGTIYETENFSNVKITANGTHPNGVAYGPASFFVEYPDGAIASYATVSPTDWAITYWQNAQGVRINYLYTNTDNVLTISKITYGATYANVAINEINFDYSIARIRPEEVYIGGLLFKNSKILNSINIKGNSIDFKNYILAHNTTSLNYQSLTSITEKCGDNSLTLSPTVFTYSESYESIVYNYSSTTGIPFTNVKLTNSATVPGDYNGDGKMDFLLYPTLSSDPNKNKRITVISNIDGSAPNFGQSITLTEPFIEIFPTKFITYLNKLSAQDGFTVINRGANPLTMIKFNNLYYDPVGIYQQNLKTIDFGLTYLSVKFFNGDFNGDGLTDVVCLSPNGNYFVNLDMRDTVSKYLSPITEDISVATNFRTGDFNGDGKTDLFIYKNQQLKVYSLNSNNQIVEIMSYSDSNIILTTQILVGDLNGDGKTDFTIPNANNSTTWYSYISTGNSYLKTTKTFYNYIHPVTNTSNYIHYILQDYNNDGKSDLLIMKANGIDTTVSGSVSVHCFKNKNNYFEVNAGLNGDYFASSNSQLGIDKWALPIFYNSIQVNRKLELAFIRDSKIHFFQSLKDFNEDKLIRSVTDGNGVIDAITYKPLIEDPDNNESLGNPNVYFPEGNYLENYPNTDIINAPTFQVVKKLERISSNNSGSSNRKQFFSYYGAVSNLEGQGFLGFRGTTRTNWHTGVAPFYMISNVARNDISLRGSNVESYSAVGWWKPTMSLSSFSSFISKNKTTYNTDNISGAVNSPLLTNKVYKLFANKIENADGLLGTSSETKITYDTFNNPLTATNNTKNGSVVEKTTLTTLTYQNTNVAGNTYIIGRPLTKSETSTIYPNLPDQDIFNSSESYIYTNNLLTRLRKRGNGSTQSIFEYNEYDIFGNIIKKTISDGNSGQIAPLSRGVDNATNIDEPISAAAPENPLVPRIVNYVYNPVAPFFGRFLTSSIDLQGLTTTYNYNGSNGTLLSETNPYGLVTSYNYDKWFKKTATTDYLGNVTTIQYFKYSNSSRIIITPPQGGGVYTEETFNVLGLKVRSGSKNIDGNPVFVSYQYDMNDKLITTSEPFIPNGVLPQTNTIVYDLYGRVTSTTDYKNKTTTISYSNLTTTVNDGTLEKVTVKNAMENEVSVTDNPGGTITNKYFANGNLKSTTYDNGGTTTITQDNWGRKKTLTDPSAGLFSYFYNFFGEIITESNPNGSISYAYDNVGKLLTKKVVGTNGDNTITTNTYDEAGSKLLTATTFNDITAGQVTNYTFGYDNFKRPNFSDESGTKAYFQRATQYDTFGRKTNQLYTAINAANSTQTSSKWTCNVYKNGYLHQLKEGLNGTGVVLYQTNSVNAKGQVLTSQIGNGVAIANEYDIYGFPTKMQHDKGVTNIMTLNNTFDNVRGNLITRDNNLFGTGANLWSEDFTNRYDSNDRLLGYKDHTGNYLTQSYNTNGTISSNVVGANTYNSTKPFQATFIPVTNQSPNYNYYSTRAQTIVYNAIKKPITIVEVGQENINFDYNMKGQRSTMYYGNTNPDKNLRTYIKSYSADGSMEIRRNTTTNAIEIITYLGGDAYSAPLMLKSDGTINTSQNFLYLHRDYQGSILTITDNVGVVQEKRLFDAWGTLIKFWNPTSNVVPTTTGIMITDRGYTGHEHLLGVGLINMNGRLYDTAFHRFLSPDNNLQEPGNTQNYNRYGYCLNNPFKYTDYAGESFWSDLGDAFTSAYHQIASGVLSIATIVLGAALVGISFAIGTAVGVIQLVGSGFKNNSILMNQTMIIGGLFQGNIGQIASRFTNELPQTLMGLGLALGVNAIGRVRSVTSYGGATAVEMYDPNWGAFTVGSYIIGEKGIQASPTNNLFKHEYGHYLQSQEAGSNYMYDYGFSSLISAGNSDRQNPHHASWTEQDANIRAINYFGSDGWDYNKFQVFGSGQNNQFDRDFGHLRRNRVRVGGGWLTLSH